MKLSVSNSLDKDSPDWAARTTVNQFRALGIYADFCLSDGAIWQDFKASLKRRPIQRIDGDRVRKLLVNSWNTERLLRITKESFSGPENGFVAQWSFPQAYYSVFNSTLASFAASGFTETAHTAVREKVARLALENKLPALLNVYSDGGKKSLSLSGIESSFSEFKSGKLDPRNFEEVKRHLMSFFRTTRRMYLDEKKEKKKFKTKKGDQNKKALSQEEWQQVSDSLGPTSWLCLLYRKRIQSNYRDIETFLSPEFAVQYVLEGLVAFVYAFNLTNEINVTHHMGIDPVAGWVPAKMTFVHERMDRIRSIPDSKF